jgi:hypothetical protein
MPCALTSVRGLIIHGAGTESRKSFISCGLNAPTNSGQGRFRPLAVFASQFVAETKQHKNRSFLRFADARALWRQSKRRTRQCRRCGQSFSFPGDVRHGADVIFLVAPSRTVLTSLKLVHDPRRIEQFSPVTNVTRQSAFVTFFEKFVAFEKTGDADDVFFHNEKIRDFKFSLI